MTVIEATTTTTELPARALRVAGRVYPVVLPDRRDPRLHLASVIITLQILGQTTFHFDLSIPQMLAALLTSALLEVAITFARKRVVAWPASAMLTGNGVAFVLRVPGTRHGDWWSTRGLWIFAGTAAVSLLSKYLIRWRGRHIFNPSNFGLVACFLILGSKRAEPLDFWWVRMGPALATALAVIVVGGVLITRRTQMLGAAVAFWLTFATLIGVVAASGHCMTARWHLGPVCGQYFWFVLVTSPEILVFMFFMITDPKTAPAGRRARIVYACLVAAVSAFLIAPQRTEWGTKVAVLSALAIVCLFRPLLERRVPADERPSGERSRRTPAALLGGIAFVCACTALLVAAGTHARRPVIDVTVIKSGASRQNIRIDPASIPPVTIDPAVSRINVSLSPRTARELVRDLLADLAIEAEALKQRSETLLTTADVGPRYLKVAKTIADTAPTAEIVVSDYELDTAKIVLSRTNFQSGPQIAARVTGTVRRVGYRGSTAGRVITGRTRFARTFVFLHDDDHYFIATDLP